MTSVFEDRLWEMLQQHAESPGDDHVLVEFPAAPRRRVVNGRRAGAALTVAAAAGLTFFYLPGGGSTPAYAVEPQQGDHVKVTVDDLGIKPADLLTLEDKLRAAGIHVVVDATGPYTCGLSSDKGSPESGSTEVVWPGAIWETPSKDGPKDTSGQAPAGAMAVSGSQVGPDGRLVAVLDRGDTAFINARYSKAHHRLVDIHFASGTCTPQSGS